MNKRRRLADQTAVAVAARQQAIRGSFHRWNRRYPAPNRRVLHRTVVAGLVGSGPWQNSSTFPSLPSNCGIPAGLDHDGVVGETVVEAS